MNSQSQVITRARNNRLVVTQVAWVVFALTLAPGFFSKMGFHTVEHRQLPLKVWTDCVNCPKYGNCDEIAMVLDVQPVAA